MDANAGVLPLDLGQEGIQSLPTYFPGPHLHLVVGRVVQEPLRARLDSTEAEARRPAFRGGRGQVRGVGLAKLIEEGRDLVIGCRFQKCVRNLIAVLWCEAVWRAEQVARVA